MGNISVYFTDNEADFERRVRAHAKASGKSDSTCLKELIGLGLSSLDSGLDTAATIDLVQRQLKDLLDRQEELTSRVFKSPDSAGVVIVTLLECVMLLRYMTSNDKVGRAEAQKRALTTYENLKSEGTA